MNGMLRDSLRHGGRRYFATGMALAVAMAVVAACLCVAQSMRNNSVDAVTGAHAGVAAVVEINPEPSAGLGQEAPDLSAAADELQAAVADIGVFPEFTAYAELTAPSGKRASYSVSSLPPSDQGVGRIVEGKPPAGPDEIALQRSVADYLLVDIDEDVDVQDFFNHPGLVQGTTTVKVVGLTEPPASVTDANYMTPDGLSNALPTAQVSRVNLVAGTDADPSDATQDDVAAKARGALGLEDDREALMVRPVHQVVAEQLRAATLARVGTLALLGAVSLVTLLAAAIVVRTTFRTNGDRRRHEVALLKTIGATSGQVRGLVVRESLVVGLIGTVVGIAVGGGGAAAALKQLGAVATWDEALRAINPLVMAGVLAFGIGLAWALGYGPAAQVAATPAAAAHPSAVLEEDDASAAVAGAGRHIVRLFFGVVLTAAGAVLLYFAPRQEGEEQQILMRIGGGLALVLGVLLLTWVVMPALVRVVLAPWPGIGARMARAFVGADGDRVASLGTVIALCMAVIAATWTTAGSLQSTLAAQQGRPVQYDLKVVSSKGSMLDAAAEGLGTMEGVQATASDHAASGTATGTDLDGIAVTIIGRGDQSAVLREPMPAPGPDQVFIPAGEGLGTLSGSRFEGQSVTLCGPTELCSDFTAVLHPDDVEPGTVVIAESSLGSIAPGAPVHSVTLKMSDMADLDRLDMDVEAMDPSLHLTGPLQDQHAIAKSLSTLRIAHYALLALGVVFTLLAGANALSLSALERSDDTGLLQVVGMTRAQTRRMVAAEALGTAGAGVLLGSALGIGAGALLVRLLPLGVDHVEFSLPWWQIAATALGLVAVAAVAAWVPGRRAAETPLAEAAVLA